MIIISPQHEIHKCRKRKQGGCVGREKGVTIIQLFICRICCELCPHKPFSHESKKVPVEMPMYNYELINRTLV